LSTASLPHFKELREVFVERFPSAFLPPRPLKIGIHADIVAAMPEIAVRDIGMVLRLHVSRDAYLRAMIAGTDRVGLDGTAVGSVTEEQAQDAHKILERRAEKRARKIAAQQAEAKAAARKATEKEGAGQKAIAEKVAAKVTEAARKPVAPPPPPPTVKAAEPPPAFSRGSLKPIGRAKQRSVPVVVFKRRRPPDVA
jgi:sRNA-binding protein